MTPGAPRRPDGAALAIAAGLIGLAALIFWRTGQMEVPTTYARVGPRQFPYVVAAGLAVLGVLTAVSALRGGFPEREHDEVGPILWIVAGLVLQMILLRPAGFSLATGVLFAFVARGFGRKPVWLSLIFGTVFAFVIWVIFSQGLQLALPAGPVEDALF